jgi:S-DNA-T family DNA segregation ATPase FtsK/SpoIIIE
MAARRTRNGPAPSTMIFFIMAAVAAVPLAAWKGYPGVVASWALLIVGALAEPPPMMTGRKVAGRPPEPAGPHEERAATAYAMYRTWQWRMWTPTFDWGPGWPIRLSWIAALFAAIAALGLPVTQPIWALGNAAAAYLLTVQIRASARRSNQNCPGLTLATFRKGLSLMSLLAVPAAATGVAAGWLLPDIVERYVPDAPAPSGALFAIGLGGLGALAGLYPPWSTAALADWRLLVERRALWGTAWPSLKIDPAPTLLSARRVGVVLVETFTAPPLLGWDGMRGKSKDLPRMLPGHAVGLIPVPQEVQGQPLPGTIHPGKFAVASWDLAAPPSLTDTGLDPDVATLAVSVASMKTSDLTGFAPMVVESVERVSTDDSPTAAWLVHGGWPGGPGWTSARDGGWDGTFGDFASASAIINHRDDSAPLYVGDLDGAELEDDALQTLLSNLATEYYWKARWADVLKQGVNDPIIQHAQSRDLTYGQTVIHRAVFCVRTGADPSDHTNSATEKKMSTSVQNVPFVSIAHFTMPRRGVVGERHASAFTVSYSPGHLPASPDRVADHGEASRVILTGHVNTAFDAARLARPEVIGTECLTFSAATNSGNAMWRIDLRLVGGVTLADVRGGLERMRVGVNTPWIAVDVHPSGCSLYVGVRPDRARYAKPTTEKTITRLVWDSAWLAAAVRGAEAKTPSLQESVSLPKNPAVSRLTFRLPTGTSMPDIVKALPKMRTGTGNAFVEIDRERSTADNLTLMVSREDPMPKRVGIDPDEFDGSTNFPLAVGATGESEFWSLSDSPHIAVVGQSGSGKTGAMAALSMGVLMAGFDLIIIDPMKSCADFRWAQPWTLAMAPDLPTGSAAMRWVIGEVDRRKTLNSTHGARSYLELPEDIRPKPIVVMIDEFTSLIEKTVVARTPSADPEMEMERQKAIASNLLTDDIGSIAGRISREARSAGVHLVIGGQKLRTTDLDKIPGGGTLKVSLARVLLGSTSDGDRRSALRAPDAAPLLDGAIPIGRGVYEPSNGSGRLIQVRYEDPDELAARIAAVRQPAAPLDLTTFTRAPVDSKPLVQEVDMGAELFGGTVEEVDAGAGVEFDLSEFDLSEFEFTLDDTDNPTEEDVPDSPAPIEADDPSAGEFAVDETPDWVTDIALAEESFTFDDLVPDDDDDDDDDDVSVPFSLDDLLIDQDADWAMTPAAIESDDWSMPTTSPAVARNDWTATPPPLDADDDWSLV